MIGYKLTDQNDRTRNDTRWGEGVEHTAPGTGILCDSGWIHLYEHPLLAVLHDPIGAKYGEAAHLWECEYGEPILRDGQIKLGAARVRTLRRIPLPFITDDQRIRYAIACAWQVCDNPGWRRWATKWLDGTDRTREMAVLERSDAKAMVDKARALASTASEMSAMWSMEAARAAASSAASVTVVAEMEIASAAASAEMNLAWVARANAESTDVKTPLDLIRLAEWAMTDSIEVPDAIIEVESPTGGQHEPSL